MKKKTTLQEFCKLHFSSWRPRRELSHALLAAPAQRQREEQGTVWNLIFNR